CVVFIFFFFFSSRRRHTRFSRDWSSDVCSSDLICGKTDMRKGIDGLATLIQDSLELDPYGDSIFLFAGWKKDRYKCLYFDGDGRSEERRVGKECRSRWSRYDEKKKKNSGQ